MAHTLLLFQSIVRLASTPAAVAIKDTQVDLRKLFVGTLLAGSLVASGGATGTATLTVTSGANTTTITDLNSLTSLSTTVFTPFDVWKTQPASPVRELEPAASSINTPYESIGASSRRPKSVSGMRTMS